MRIWLWISPDFQQLSCLIGLWPNMYLRGLAMQVNHKLFSLFHFWKKTTEGTRVKHMYPPLLWLRLVSYQRLLHSHVWPLKLAAIWYLSWEFCLQHLHMACECGLGPKGTAGFHEWASCAFQDSVLEVTWHHFYQSHRTS